jgi:hypothetical protein
MRRKLLGFGLVLLLVLGSFQAVWAVGTYTEGFRCYGNGSACVWTISWTAHTDGTWTARSLAATAAGAKSLTALAGYYLYEMETDPSGSAAPASYAVTLTATGTDFSYDILGGRGASRSATVTQSVFPANTTGSRFPVIGNDTYTLGITGATNNGAKGVIRFWFVK